jgi:hypothetical protein
LTRWSQRWFWRGTKSRLRSWEISVGWLWGDGRMWRWFTVGWVQGWLWCGFVCRRESILVLMMVDECLSLVHKSGRKRCRHGCWRSRRQVSRISGWVWGGHWSWFHWAMTRQYFYLIQYDIGRIRIFTRVHCLQISIITSVA